MAGGGLEDQRGHGKTLKEDLYILGVDWRVTREILSTIVPDGDNSLPNVLLRTGGTKSKSKSLG